MVPWTCCPSSLAWSQRAAIWWYELGERTVATWCRSVGLPARTPGPGRTDASPGVCGSIHPGAGMKLFRRRSYVIPGWRWNKCEENTRLASHSVSLVGTVASKTYPYYQRNLIQKKNRRDTRGSADSSINSNRCVAIIITRAFEDAGVGNDVASSMVFPISKTRHAPKQVQKFAKIANIKKLSLYLTYNYILPLPRHCHWFRR